MAAGLGFKTFNTGDVLSAGDTNGYLMQGIWVFANATARDAAVTSPQEGNSCYLKDTDEIQVYSGSAWVVKSASGTASGFSLVNRSTFSNVASHSVDNVFTSSYKSYVIVIEGMYGASGGAIDFNFRYGGSSGTTATDASHYWHRAKGLYNDNSWSVGNSGNGVTSIKIGDNCGTSGYPFNATVNVFNVGNASERPTITFLSNIASGSAGINVGAGQLFEGRTYTGFILTGGSNITGAVAVYGYGV